MIQQERIEINGTEYIRTYSDQGLLIHGGFPEGDYAEAIDPVSMNREYIETDIPVESDDEGQTEEEQYAEAGRILLGVKE